MIQIKRYFITLVALFAMLALGGCGGGDNASSTVGESLENTQSVSLVEASKIQFSTATVQEKSSGTIATTSGGETIFSLTVRYQKNLNENYDVSIDMTAVEIDGCEVSNVVFTPNPVVLNGNLNSTEALTVSGNVNSDCQNDTRYTLGGTVNISNGENRTQESLLVSSQSLTDVAVEEGATDAVIDPDAPQTDEGYMFGNTNAPVPITPNQQTYELRVQLLKDELVAEGKEITLKAFDAVYGNVKDYSVTTGTDGYAVFEYTAPATLPESGTTVTLTFVYIDANNTELTKEFTLKFESADVPTEDELVDTSSYHIDLLPTVLSISEAEETQPITLQVLNTNNVPVAGIAVYATTGGLANGVLSQYEGVSDANGKVSFSYTAPQTLPTTPVEIKFAFENATDAKEQIVTVNFIPTTYSMESDANITVSALDSDYPISVTVKAQEGSDPVQPAVGAVVIAEVLDAVNGSLATYEVTVGDSGVATFMYHSPVRTLPENNVSVKFYLKEDMTQTAETKLLFDPVVVDTVAQVYLSPASLIITEANVTKKITIVTVNADNIGISTELQVEQPNNGTDYGHFDLSTVTTDASGYAELLYTAPSDISNLDERNITITELSQNITQQLRIGFTTLTSSKNYEIVERVPDNLEVDGFGSMGIRIEEVGAEGKLIDDSNVKEVNVTTLFENMLLVGAGETMMQYSGIADQGGIKLEAQHLSGVAMVEVSALINDGENDVVITKLVPVTVLSGSVTSMSLAYVGSEVDESGLFLNHYVLHAVDQYANPAKEGLVFHPALVSGTKVVVPNPLMVGGTGELLNGTPSFRDNGTSFADVSAEDNDRVIVMPNLRDYYVQDYIGNWKISEVISEHELAFESVFSGEEKENLSYVIGSDKRAFDGGLLIATADVANPDGLFVLGKDGTAPLEVKFDPVLAGHTYVMGAYIDDGNRTGVAIKEAFRWGGYTSTTKEVDNDGSSYTVGLQLGIEGGGSAEHLKELTLASDSFVLDHPEECDINVSASDFTTDDNGYVVLEVITAGSDDEVKTCSVTWNKNPGSILYEY